MLPFHPKRLVIALHTLDYRKQWNGLLAECYRLGFDPYAGDCVAFVKKDRTQLRALAGDTRGLFLIARRFEGGRLGLDWAFQEEPNTKSITIAELGLLLEGASYTVHRYVKPWK